MSPDEKKPTILIVEDDPFILEASTEKLSREGFTILQAKDGVQGLDMSMNQKPDLILLDILMPNMDGLEMLNRLRQDESGKNAHVIIITNLIKDESEREARRLGVDDYIIKANWSLGELTRKVKSVLGVE
ncbi:MAG: response regulator [Candidatus Kerfeldbacteria bacterium]